MQQSYYHGAMPQCAPGTKKPNPALRKFNLLVRLVLVGCVTPGYAVTSYTVTDLTALTSDGTMGPFIPTGINASGQIVGNSEYDQDAAGTLLPGVPFVYNSANGSLVNIQKLASGGSLRDARDINASGQVLGRSSIDGHVVRNPNGTIVKLIAPSLGVDYVTPIAINNKGQVTGNGYADGNICGQKAIVWDINGNKINSLGSLGTPILDTRNRGTSNAFDINNNGQVVGNSTIPLVSTCTVPPSHQYIHAFVSTPTELKDLHLGSSSTQTPSGAYAINDSGLAVGYFTAGFSSPILPRYPLGVPVKHAVVWNTATGTYIDLAATPIKTNTSGGLIPPPSYTPLPTSSVLLDINASGQVVGQAGGYGNYIGVVGSAKSGGLIDLNTLVPAGWRVTSANHVNDAGQILASGDDGVKLRDFLLTPTTPTPITPAAPTRLTATVTSSSQINLRWADNATDETAQYLERCQGAGCTNFIEIATVAANVTSYTNKALIPSTRYRYRVRAHNAAGNSAYSNIAAATTVPLIPVTTPTAPSNLTSVAKTRNQIVLNWVDRANNEQNYLIERCKGLKCNAFNQVASVRANVTRYSNAGLSVNTNYSYRVRAANEIGKSAYGNVLSVKTLP